MTAVATADISVLVVEDSADHRDLMERRLVGAGLRVRTAATGEEALDQLDGVDLVLLDQGLPRMSGLDLLHAIRSASGGPSVVMVTALGSTDLAVEAMRAGAIDFLPKSTGYLEELPGVIERAWRHHDLARRADELQQLALLLHSAEGLEGVRSRIVDGARRLLRADAAALVELGGAGTRLHQTSGEPGDALEHLIGRSRDELPEPGETALVGPGDLAVALPAEPGEPYALLALFRLGPPGGLSEEIELARAFASFAAVALRNLRQRGLEQELIAELQHTIEARRDFVASVSHELRTPLTSISGYVQTVLDRWEQIPEERVRDYLGRVRRNTLELGRLVEQLIDLAGIERGQRFDAHPEVVELRDAVDRVLEQLGVLLEGREVEVDVAPGSRVLADPALLHRSLANLVSNAVKYSAPASPIAIRGRVEDDRGLLDVVDHGIGLDPREATRVFDPFWRAGSSVTNAVRGSGIGLALVREYVRSMGGEVAVRSELGRGSTFTLALPLERASTAPPGHAVSGP